MAELSATLLNNIGACYYSAGDYKKGVIFFNEALMVKPTYIKALWKRALCQYELANYEEALDDIKKAYNLDKSKEIYESYAIILKSYNEGIKKDKEKMKEMSTKIFNSQNGSQKEMKRDE